ncbi:ATP-binding protein [Amycolatopsis balhimycina DSM 5908]|uniref:ATP-binding protein n=1 Tax=Amycolatopsis balhimycina DSM 5908 TaxID=1081091 RepID=A0A428WJF5_AMYBA|nr:ATP-binding protein [Amycolatopsis balhimycina]RSM43150.1 ATP-binding protein [Amycolatopsis balhimycina DSM 5908]
MVNKFVTDEPVFAVQVLIRCESEISGRAQAHLRSVIGAFDVYRGENYWRVRGPRVFGWHFGADTILVRRLFDRRFRTGLTKPRTGSLVTAGEIAALLKPPSGRCQSPAIARSRGWVLPAPREIPTYRPGTGTGTGLVRLGYVTDVNGDERLVGVPLRELLFSARFGKAGFGKTEEALAQAIEIARLGGGVWFLDPHADGWKRAKPYLSDPALRARLWEVNLDVRGRDKHLPGWNPLSMQGFTESDIEDRVDAVVTSFAAALGWGDAAPRAKSILTKACEALCYLAMRLPADCAPTIFQIPTLLDDETWRESILPTLKPSVRRYWTDSFPKLAPDATTVVTNIINRLRTSPTLSAFLGSSVTTYDVRRAMDTGRIVFVCTTGTGETNKLITSFMIYDLFRAGRSRADTPVEQRRRCDAFVDELAAVDGASRGYLAAILEQLRKYRVALHAMNQMPDRLAAETRRALLQNQSLLMTSAAAIDGARTVAREFGGLVQPATVTELEQFHHVVTVTLGGQRTTPFKIRGLHVDDEFAEHFHPEWNDDVDQALDANLARRPIGEVLDELEDLDDRILAALRAEQRAPQSRRGRPPTRGSGAAIDLTSSVE